MKTLHYIVHIGIELNWIVTLHVKNTISVLSFCDTCKQAKTIYSTYNNPSLNKDRNTNDKMNKCTESGVSQKKPD